MVCEAIKSQAILILNVAAAVCIIAVNKTLLTSFPYSMTLTFFQITVGGMLIMGKACRIRPENSMPLWANLWYSFLFIACIYAQTFSLKTNSVTLFQISKLLVIPSQCLMQYFTKHKVFTKWVYGSLFILAVGVALSTVAELHFEATIYGVSVALIATFLVVVEQAETGRLKEKFELNSVDFMHSHTMHRIIMSACLILVVEQKALRDIPQMSIKNVVLLLMSCLLALTLNLTSVFIIGKFGAVASAVMGHSKTVFIFAIGFAMHPPPVDLEFAKDLTGIAIALFGAVKYGQYTACPEADWCGCCRAEENKMEAIDLEENGCLSPDLVEEEPFFEDDGISPDEVLCHKDPEDYGISPDVLGNAQDEATQSETQ